MVEAVNLLHPLRSEPRKPGEPYVDRLTVFAAPAGRKLRQQFGSRFVWYGVCDIVIPLPDGSLRVETCRTPYSGTKTDAIEALIAQANQHLEGLNSRPETAE